MLNPQGQAMLRPIYHISNSILNYISQIETAKEVINNAPLIPIWEERFKQDALTRMAHHGTHIEGNPLELDEASRVLQGQQISARDRDIQEVLNYRDVIKFIDQQSDQNEAIDEKVILELHRRVVKKVVAQDFAGNYRTVQVVLRSSKTKEVSYKAPHHTEVSKLMNEFTFWLNHTDNTDIHPVIKAAIAMYELNAIHPYVEGNGRTSRAVATLILFKNGYDVKKFFSLEEYYDTSPNKYYAALQKVSNQHQEIFQRDLTTWVEYFCEGLAIELGKVKQKVQKLSVDLKLKGKVGQIALNDRQIKLVEYMEEFNQITAREWRNLLPMVSDDTVQRDLKDLLKKKVIRKRGSTKAAVYLLRK